jgi:L-asparaginase
MKIRVLVTGGTFDKEYNELNGELFFQDTHLREMLRLGRCQLDLEVQRLMMIDSLEMNDAHREEVLRACVAAKGERIVVTHGTDTMEVTARYLGERVKGQTIVLTGAMVPYTFGSSDGLFNLGSALAFAQSMPEGVYVAMNGRCFDWNNVRKNRETGRFVESSAS